MSQTGEKVKPSSDVFPSYVALGEDRCDFVKCLLLCSLCEQVRCRELEMRRGAGRGGQRRTDN